MSEHAPIFDPQQLTDVAKRILERCDVLARLSEEPKRLTRTFCCEPMKKVHEQLTEWMQTVGMTSRVDALGNHIGTSEKRGDKVFMIGSHLDTVVNAGKYDGTLGVLLGLGAAELLKGAEITLPFTLEVVGFSEEEGVRFQTPYLGSRAIAGEFSPEMLEFQDAKGITVKTALEEFGVAPNQWRSAAYPMDDLIGFLEPHIEQGPVLDDLEIPVAVVTAIAGQTRATISFVGQAGHAGTVPLSLRKDALTGAAELISAIETLAGQTAGLFATVGNIRVEPNVPNVIPGQVDLRLDLRHAENDARLQAFEQIQQLTTDIATNRNIGWSVESCEHQPAVPMDASLTEKLLTSLERTGQPKQTLVSGAGHDAVMMARRTSASMLFLRCHEGISHHPREQVDEHAVSVALEVLVDLLTNLRRESP